MAITKFTTGAIYGILTSTTMTAEPTTSSAGNIYQITSSLHQVIDPSVTLSLNATAATYLDTTYFDGGWNYFTGQFHLTTPTSPTVTGAWLTMTSLGSVISWTLNPTKNTQEITAIGDTWKSYAAIENGVKLTLNRYYIDPNFWIWVNAGNPILLKIWEDAVDGFWVKGFVTSFGPTLSVGAVDKEAITVTISGPVSYF